MKDAEDAAIVRQVVRAVAAAIFCLLCGGVAGIFVVRSDGGSQVGVHHGELAPASPPIR
jgi:hypothetical protein